MSAATTS
jgi:hypothetical protein